MYALFIRIKWSKKWEYALCTSSFTSKQGYDTGHIWARNYQHCQLNVSMLFLIWSGHRIHSRRHPRTSTLSFALSSLHHHLCSHPTSHWPSPRHSCQFITHIGSKTSRSTTTNTPNDMINMTTMSAYLVLSADSFFISSNFLTKLAKIALYVKTLLHSTGDFFIKSALTAISVYVNQTWELGTIVTSSFKFWTSWPAFTYMLHCYHSMRLFGRTLLTLKAFPTVLSPNGLYAIFCITLNRAKALYPNATIGYHGCQLDQSRDPQCKLLHQHGFQ